MVNINGIDLDFNLYDYDVAAKYEAALTEVANAKHTGAGLSETIKEQCLIVFKFFDSVFGDGTAERVFQGKYDFRACTAALGEVINDAKAQQQEYSALLNRYAPNRAARRASK